MARKPILRASECPVAGRFVSYCRVSTDKQGRSGLGLDAQREAVARHVQTAAGVIVAEFQEVESGKRDDNRPQLKAAISACRAHRATLVIAKLDRLSRNLAFLANLMETGLDFVACDNPHATPFTLHILAAVAEHERRMISARTKEALAAARARGVKLGGPNAYRGSPDLASANRRRLADSRQHASDVAPFIEAARGAGAATLVDLARALNARGVLTPSGGSNWTHVQVRRVLDIHRSPR